MKITLLISCKDQKGIISKVTDFIHKNDGNITYLDQFVERDKREFFMRLESEFITNDFNIDSFKNDFTNEIGIKLNFSFKIFKNELKKKMAVFISKYEHCVYDILSRYKAGELNVEIPLIISNHKHLSHVANIFGIPFYHIKHNRDCKDRAQVEQINNLKIEFGPKKSPLSSLFQIDLFFIKNFLICFAKLLLALLLTNMTLP